MLRGLGHEFLEGATVVVDVMDRPGGLADVAERFATAGVNILGTLCVGRREGVLEMAFAVDDAEKARAALAAGGAGRDRLTAIRPPEPAPRVATDRLRLRRSTGQEQPWARDPIRRSSHASLDEVRAATAGESAPRDVHPVRDVRRLVPVGGGHGPHAAAAVRDDPGRAARRGPAQQHALDVRVLLLLRGPLPAGDPHPGRDVRAQGDRHARRASRPSRPRRTSRGPSSTTSSATGGASRSGSSARHYLRHYPLRLPGMAPMGIGMVTKGRMGFVPHRIQRRRRASGRSWPGPAELEAAGSSRAGAGVTQLPLLPGLLAGRQRAGLRATR